MLSMRITGLEIPGRYRKALLASQPDKSEFASESLTSGKFSNGGDLAVPSELRVQLEPQIFCRTRLSQVSTLPSYI